MLLAEKRVLRFYVALHLEAAPLLAQPNRTAAQEAVRATYGRRVRDVKRGDARGVYMLSVVKRLLAAELFVESSVLELGGR